MYCPIPAGPFAFSTSIPWSSDHELTTQSTQIHAVDPYGYDMLCLNVETTPLGPRRLGSPYGRASIIFWATVTLAIAYWLVVGITRIVSAWGRGYSSRPGSGFWPKVEGAGFILASAISGERLATSPALLRFCEQVHTLHFIFPNLFHARFTVDARYRISQPVVRGSRYGSSAVAEFCV
jgi:hypothetical protein